MKIMTFESWQNYQDATDKCLVCGETSNKSSLCDKCENDGWWIDPAGGVHSPDLEDDFADPAAMYEKFHTEFYDETEPEEDLDPPFKKPKTPTGIGAFSNIDWEMLHETLVMNTQILKDKTSSNISYNVGDLTDHDGMLSYDELKLLEEGDLIYIFDGTPIIDDEAYLNYETFYKAAELLWAKTLN